MYTHAEQKLYSCSHFNYKYGRKDSLTKTLRTQKNCPLVMFVKSPSLQAVICIDKTLGAIQVSRSSRISSLLPGYDTPFQMPPLEDLSKLTHEI